MQYNEEMIVFQFSMTPLFYLFCSQIHKLHNEIGMYNSPVQILVKYLTDSSNSSKCVDSSKKFFGSIHRTVFFPQGLKVSALVCVENGLNLVG